MKLRRIAVCVATGAVLFIGCNATSRYEVLSTVFDGVPTPAPAARPATDGQGSASPVAVAVEEFKPRDHGPYAARLCNACHESAATNALVVPREQLCFRCHEIKLDKKYIHGPLASGGCLSCHDPHGSRYRYMLVSEASTFCLYCHDRQAIAKNPAHASLEGQCTDCHDAHMSDKRYLLK